MLVRHSPGDWYGVVTPAGLALLPPAVPLVTVEQIWRDLGSGRGLSAVIDGLVGVFGMSLSGLPSFAVISLAEPGSARTALRGEVTARLWLLDDSEPVAISGSGVTTWNERVFGQARQAELSLPTAGEHDLLPLIDGVVSAGRLLVESLGGEEESGSVRVLPRMSASVPEAASFTSAASDVASVPGQLTSSKPVIEPVPDDAAGEQAPAPAPSPRVEPEIVSADEQDGSAEAVPTSETALAADPELPASDEPAPTDPQVKPDPASVPSAEFEVADRTPELFQSAETLVDDEAPNEYDRLLFGETVLSSVEAAAVRAEDADALTEDPSPARPIPPVAHPAASAVPPPPPPLPGLIGGVPSFGTPPPPPSLGDHDGETVLVEDLQHLLGGTAAPRQVTLPPGAPSIRAVPKLVISGREPLPLSRTAIVGTRPRLSRVQGDNAPQLVAVESPNGEISRSHVELRVEGVNVLAVDLNSTNGTILLRTGSDPVRLQPGEPSILVSGDRIDLGDGVVLGFEGLE